MKFVLKKIIGEYGFSTSELETALKEATAYLGGRRMELQILPLPRGSGLPRTCSLVSQAVTTWLRSQMFRSFSILTLVLVLFYFLEILSYKISIF